MFLQEKLLANQHNTTLITHLLKLHSYGTEIEGTS